MPVLRHLNLILGAGCSHQNGEATGPVTKIVFSMPPPLPRVSEGRALWEPEVDSYLALWAPGFRLDANREVTGYQRRTWLARLHAQPSRTLLYLVSEPRETESQCPGPDGNSAPCRFTVLIPLPVHPGTCPLGTVGSSGPLPTFMEPAFYLLVFPSHSRFSLGLGHQKPAPLADF